jgi:predicted RNA binding protein YcfA (HicA-like mRNA interferase family)
MIPFPIGWVRYRQSGSNEHLKQLKELKYCSVTIAAHVGQIVKAILEEASMAACSQS